MYYDYGRKYRKLHGLYGCFFVDMDPFLMLERMDIPGYFALAASETDEAGAQELPAGLLLCAMKKSSLVIEWIYVRKEFCMQNGPMHGSCMAWILGLQWGE